MADFEKKVGLIQVDIDNAAAQKQVEKLTSRIIENKDALKDNNAAIRDLNKSNKELETEVKKGTKTEKEASDQIIKNNKQINDLEKANFSLRDSTKDLNSERSKAVKSSKLQSDSLDALRFKTARMKEELNGLELANESGTKEFIKLSKEIEKNNSKITELDQSAGDFKTTVGQYANELDKGTDSLNKFSAGAADSSDMTEKMTNGLAGTAKGFAKMTVQALKFILTPVGAVLAAIAGAVLLVKNAMDRSTESSNKMTKIFNKLGSVISTVQKILEPFGEFLIDNILIGFEKVGEAASWAMDAISSTLKNLGYEDAAKTVDDFTRKIEEGVEVADKMSDAQAQLNKRLREAEKIQLDYQAKAEKLRQIRDEEANSLEVRSKANEDLNKLLKEQFAFETSVAQKMLKHAEMRISLEGEETDALNAKAEAELKITEIEERILGFQSEYLMNVNGLRRDLAAKAKEDEAAAQKRLDDEAAELEASKEAAREKFELQVEFNDKVRELAILKKAREDEERLRDLEGTAAYFEEKRRIEQENYDIEQEILLERAMIDAENETLSKEEKLIAQAEFDLLVEEARQAHADKMLAIEKEQSDSTGSILDQTLSKIEKFQKFANKVTKIGLDIGNNLVENRYNDRMANIDAKLKAGVITEQQYANEKEKIEKKAAYESWKVSKKQFLIEKAQALISIAVDTAKGVGKALAKGIPVGPIEAAITTGLGIAQAVAVGTKKAPPAPQFRDGGMVVKGASHEQGGIPIHVGGNLVGEMEGDEGMYITNKAATKQLLSDVNVGNGGRSFFDSSVRYAAEGGRINTDVQNGVTAEAIAAAVSTLAIKVEVESVMAGMIASENAKQIGVI